MPFSLQLEDKFQRLLKRYPITRSALIPILLYVQDEQGYLSKEMIAEISHRGFVAHGIRTSADKYVRRFSPEEDELYFDLRRDPKEQHSILEQFGERVFV